MISLIVLIVLGLTLLAYLVIHRKLLPTMVAADGNLHRRLLSLGFTVIYVPLLIVAARFGARTFPGIWVPGGSLLNDLTQGGMFYVAAGLVVVCGIIDVLMVAAPVLRGGFLNRLLIWTKRLSLGFAGLVCLAGLIAAAEFQRLP